MPDIQLHVIVAALAASLVVHTGKLRNPLRLSLEHRDEFGTP
jgi:hypothetical protein